MEEIHHDHGKQTWRLHYRRRNTKQNNDNSKIWNQSIVSQVLIYW
jgi:hypothetical protein